MGSPFWAATMILPRATWDSDRSIISGSPSRRGNMAAMGLVPNSGALPPHGAMAAGELPKASPTMPGLSHGTQVQRRRAEVVAVGDPREGDAEVPGAAHRFAHRQRAGGIGHPARCIHQHRAAALVDHPGLRVAVGAAVSQVRAIERCARHPVGGQSLGIGGHQELGGNARSGFLAGTRIDEGAGDQILEVLRS
jgi:hypothetical protein